MSVFPTALDNLNASKTNATDQATDHPTHHNSLADAINAVQDYLLNQPNAMGLSYRFDLDLDEDVPVLWLGNYQSDPSGPNVNAILVLHGAYSNADNLLGMWNGPLASVNGAIDIFTGNETVLYTANTVTNITTGATVYNADIVLSNAGNTARAVGYQSALFESGALLAGQTVAFVASFEAVWSGVGAGAVTSGYGFHAQHISGATSNNVLMFLGASGVNAPVTPGSYAIASESAYESYMKGLLTLSASTTSRATLRIPHGTAPTSPTNGDMWTTTAGLFVRINGGTVGPLS